MKVLGLFETIACIDTAHVVEEIMLLGVKIMGHVILDQNFYCCYLKSIFDFEHPKKS